MGLDTTCVKADPGKLSRSMLPSGSDLLTVGLLVALEAMLSVDNALVMAVMVLGLPRHQHKKALHYGLVGGFAMRILATLLAVYLIRVSWVKLIGGLYLLYLTYSHFFGHEEGKNRLTPPKAKPMCGLSALWATIVRVELVNLAFSIDSIVVAVAMSPKTWVVMTGGVLGIVALRVVVGRLIAVVQKYPTLVDAAFVIIAWVGVKLALDYLHAAGYVDFEIPQAVSLGFIIAIFAVAYVYARMKGAAAHAVDPMEEKARQLLTDDRQA
jgi:YkoY family integral membrane protein